MYIEYRLYKKYIYMLKVTNCSNEKIIGHVYIFLKDKICNLFNYKKISNSISLKLIEELFNNLEAENKSQKVKQMDIIQDPFICDDPLYICIFKNIGIFIEENTYKLLFYILSAILILLFRAFIIYRTENYKNKKKMSLKEFINFLKKYYSFLLYILLIFLFIILYTIINKYTSNIYKSIEYLYKIYKRLLRLFTRVEFLEKMQKLGFDKINEDVASLFDIVNNYLVPEIINLKKEIDQIKKEIIDINSNIIVLD